MARFPFPPSPVGWFQIACSDELPVAGVLPVRAFGRELEAWRDGEGVARVVGAGASWPVHEAGGLVLVHHGEGPLVERPPIPALGEEPWEGADERRRFTVRTHVQEVVENLVDGAHFLSVHGTATLPAVTATPLGPLLRVENRMGMRTPRGERDVTIDVRAHGMGVLLTRFTGIVDTLLVVGLCPIDEERIEIRLSFRVSREGGASKDHGVGAALIADVVRQTEEDIVIWEHKVYRERPALCAYDRPITVVRAWARQFYATAA